MGFNDLKRLINERKQRREQRDPAAVTTDPEIEKARVLLQRLQTNYIVAYQQRRDKWFEKHPGEKYFDEIYEDFVNDCEVDEWFW